MRCEASFFIRQLTESIIPNRRNNYDSRFEKYRHRNTNSELPKEALRYTLCGNGNVRNTSIYLNGKELTLGENDELPTMEGVKVSGTIELAPGTCTFLVM